MDVRHECQPFDRHVALTAQLTDRPAKITVRPRTRSSMTAGGPPSTRGAALSHAPHHPSPRSIAVRRGRATLMNSRNASTCSIAAPCSPSVPSRTAQQERRGLLSIRFGEVQRTPQRPHQRPTIRTHSEQSQGKRRNLARERPVFGLCGRLRLVDATHGARRGIRASDRRATPRRSRRNSPSV